MKKILILGGLASDKTPQTEYAKIFQKSMPQYDFTELRFDQLFVEVGPEKFEILDTQNNKDISTYDLVLFRGKIRQSDQLAFVVSRYLNFKGTKSLNDYFAYRPPSKLSQAVLFYETKVPFLPTLYSLNNQVLIDRISSNLDYPLILKDNFGSHGLNNYFIKSVTELKNTLKKNLEIKFIAQKFCPNDSDYRVLIGGDLEPLQIKRKASGTSHLNNTSQGGGAEIVDELPSAIIAQAKKIAKKLNMPLSGVDIIQEKGTHNHFFLEVNSQPQIVSGAFVDEKLKKMADLIDSSMK